MRTPKWQLVMWQGRQYAKYGRHMFKCCDRKVAPDTWVYIPEIKKCVCYKCFG